MIDIFANGKPNQDVVWEDDPFAIDYLMQSDNDFEMVGRDDVYDPFAGPEARRRKKTRAPRLFAHLDASDVPIEHETDRMSLGINYGTSRRVTNTYNIADKLERKRIAGEVGNALAWSKTATPEQLKAQMAAVAKAQQYNVAHNEKVFMKAYPRFEDDPETALAMISSVRLLDDYDAIKKGTFTRQKTTSGSGPLSARQMRLAKFLRAKEGDGVQDQMYKEEEEELAKSVESGWNLTNKAKSIPSSPIARGALGAWEIGDIGEFWQYFEQDPMAVIGHYGVEEIPSATLSRITGAAGSAIAGSIGAVAGRNIGLGLSEYASAAWTEMQRRGAMMNDPASVRRVLKQHGQEIRINALKRAMGEIFKSEATKAVKPNGQKYMKTAPKP